MVRMEESRGSFQTNKDAWRTRREVCGCNRGELERLRQRYVCLQSRTGQQLLANIHPGASIRSERRISSVTGRRRQAQRPARRHLTRIEKKNQSKALPRTREIGRTTRQEGTSNVNQQGKTVFDAHWHSYPSEAFYLLRIRADKSFSSPIQTLIAPQQVSPKYRRPLAVLVVSSRRLAAVVTILVCLV